MDWGLCTPPGDKPGLEGGLSTGLCPKGDNYTRVIRCVPGHTGRAHPRISEALISVAGSRCPGATRELGGGARRDAVTTRVPLACCPASRSEPESSLSYYQRVVMRNPASMKPKPAPRFQRPIAGIGYFSWVM